MDQKRTSAGVDVWLPAVRRSHDRLTRLLGGLSETDVTRPSYAQEWTVAQVASHLGSQAEIFSMFLQAGLSDGPAPGGEVFGPIWDRWDALPPARQVAESVASNESFVSTVEQLSPEAGQRFALSMFGTDVDLAALLSLRLAEHAVHTWDVEVALDPVATVAPEAVELLVDDLPDRVERVGTPQPDVGPLVVETTAPDHRWLLQTHPAVSLTPTDDPADDVFRLPAADLLLLVNGRLDVERAGPDVDAARLSALTTVFRGF